MTVIGGLLEINALFRLRAAQGMIGLAAKHGPGRLEAACARALAVGDPSYRTIKGVLAAGTETDPPPPAAGDAGAAAHLHGPSRLFANVVALLTTNDRPTTGGLSAVSSEQDDAEPAQGPDAVTGGRNRHGHQEPQDHEQQDDERREDEQTGTAAS